MTRINTTTPHSYSAVQSINQTHKVHKAPTPENFNHFNDHMHEIVNHLMTLRYYLNHQGAFVSDEVADWFREANVGRGTEYRHSRIKH